MKKIAFASWIEARLLTGDVIRFIKKIAWILRKSITPLVLGIIFWVAFRTIQGLSK